MHATPAHVIHADNVGHEVYAPGTPGWRQVVARFGNGIVAGDGSIDRQALGAIVFGSADELRDLNAIVHPLIAAEIEQRLRAYAESGAPAPAVIEAAILIEAGWTALVDQVWVVSAPTEAVVARIESQRGLPRVQIDARIRAQLADAERRKVADVIIENDSSLEELLRRVDAAWQSQVPS